MSVSPSRRRVPLDYRIAYPGKLGADRPEPPPGFAFLTDDNGVYLTDDNGNFLVGELA